MFKSKIYRKNLLISFLVIFFVNLSITLLLYIFFLNQAKQKLYDSYIDNAKFDFQQTKDFMKYRLEHYKNVLDSIADSKLFQAYYQDNSQKHNLVFLMKAMIKSTKSIFQIRYLDKNGMEKIRIDKDNSGKVFITERLQNKFSRYYFQKTMQLAKDQFYISDLDLNVEYGKIERPFKPTIRIAKPLYENKTFIGILILNYDAKEIISSILHKKAFNVFYMDQKGNFLLNPDSSKNFSTQLGTNYKVKDEIPNIEQLIQNSATSDINQNYYVNKFTLTDHDNILSSISSDIVD